MIINNKDNMMYLDFFPPSNNNERKFNTLFDMDLESR